MKRRYSIGTLTTAAQEVVRAPPGTTIMIDSFWIMNHSSGNSTVDMYHVPSGESVADDFLLFHNVSSRAAIPLEYRDTKIYLEPGDSIWMLAADASAVTATFYGTDG